MLRIVFINVLFIGLCGLAAGKAEARTGKDLYEEAVRSARAGDHERALALMQRYLDRRADVPPHVWFDYIALLSWAGKYREATGIFERLPARPAAPGYCVREAARCYRLSGRYEQARELYLSCLARSPGDEDAAAGLLFTCFEAEKMDEVRYYIDALARKAAGGDAGGRRRELIDRLVRNYPRDPGALLLKADLFAGQDDHARACLLYGEAERLSPGGGAARSGRYRSLAALGAVSLALEEMERSKDAPDPAARGELLSRQASAYVLSEEPDAALCALEGIDLLPGGGLSVHAGCLKITALAQKQEWKKVIEEYERLSAGGRPLPAAVKARAAFAYHCEEKPRRAVALCREVLRSPEEDGSAEARASAVALLEEYGRFREAREARRLLDAAIAPRVLEGGMMRDNLLKEEVARNTGWALAFQDRLGRAQDYFERLLSSAPANAHVRSALAHVYLWRGWPRRSLEEFRVSRTLLPGNPSIEVGYCYSLEENGYRKEARALARELSLRHPRDPDARRLMRFLESGNRPAASFKIASVQENPGAGELEWTLGYEQPAGLGLTFFAGAFFRSVSETVVNEVFDAEGVRGTVEERLEEELWRASLGLGWAVRPGTQFTVTATGAAEDARAPGIAGEISSRVSDSFAFSGRFDTFSLAVPLRARAYGIEAREAEAAVYYYGGESFAGEARASSLDMSDENKHWTYLLKADRALATGARWKTRLAFDGSLETNQNTDVPYFSPEYFASALLAPGIEHVWFRLYERSFTDRFSAGYGAQWQKGFPPDDTWFARYGQEYRFSRHSAAQWEAEYAKRDYDAADTYVWELSLDLRVRF